MVSIKLPLIPPNTEYPHNLSKELKTNAKIDNAGYMKYEK
jgi:hypothetical protein